MSGSVALFQPRSIIKIKVSCYHWRLCRCLLYGLTPEAMLVLEGHHVDRPPRAKEMSGPRMQHRVMLGGSMALLQLGLC